MNNPQSHTHIKNLSTKSNVDKHLKFTSCNINFTSTLSVNEKTKVYPAPAILTGVLKTNAAEEMWFMQSD